MSQIKKKKKKNPHLTSDMITTMKISWGAEVRE